MHVPHSPYGIIRFLPRFRYCFRSTDTTTQASTIHHQCQSPSLRSLLSSCGLQGDISQGTLLSSCLDGSRRKAYMPYRNQGGIVNQKNLSKHFGLKETLFIGWPTYSQAQSCRSISIHSSNYGKRSVESADKHIIETDEDEDKQYEEVVTRAHLRPGGGHQVYVIQPYVKWGPKKNSHTTPDLMLEEAVALVDAVPSWKCVGSIKVPLVTLEKKQLFGTGTFDKLRQQIRPDLKISAVFVSTDRLQGIQRKELEVAYGVPIFDRYSVVLRIFKERARTHEAKLQVSLAEIPYLRSCLKSLQAGARGGAKEGGGSHSIGGSGESYFEIQQRLLANREKRIRLEVEKMEKKRMVLKQQRQRREIPVVAILGYTNSGKTTLIKALSGDACLQPRDALFATLDVTTHACQLPCNLTVLLVDTVGFICDIPTALVAAFNSTLRDALEADVLVHVQDISHPDWKNQVDTVDSTLRMLGCGRESIIQVANKVDKLSEEQVEACGMDAYQISATTGQGLGDLVAEIQEQVLAVTERSLMAFRVANGGDEYQFLRRSAPVVACHPDDHDHVVLQVIVTRAVFGRIRANYPRIKYRQMTRSRAM